VLKTLAVENYRSLQRLVLSLGQITVVTGANGTGKSNLYRAVRLLAESSRNAAVAALAREGGLASTLWAGPSTIGPDVREGRQPVQGTVRAGPVRLCLGVASDDLGYAIDLGLPQRSASAFTLDPQIKRECVWSGPILRPAALLSDRRGPLVRTRDADGSWQVAHDTLAPYDSMLSEVSDPLRAPDLLALRERMRGWRFYDQIRTDPRSPARGAHIGTRTPVLAHDGADLAAALQTIIEVGDQPTLDDAIDRAFPGSHLTVVERAARFELALHQPGLLRPLGAAELSDGTLRYLLWIAALLTPRPPELLVLNEPETSLHPELLEPLADLVAEASTRTQVVVVTHATILVNALAGCAQRAGHDLVSVKLTKDDFGRTVIGGRGPLDHPQWAWPTR
jgi:predicted ATPase